MGIHETLKRWPSMYLLYVFFLCFAVAPLVATFLDERRLFLPFDQNNNIRSTFITSYENMKSSAYSRNNRILSLCNRNRLENHNINVLGTKLPKLFENHQLKKGFVLKASGGFGSSQGKTVKNKKKKKKSSILDFTDVDPQTRSDDEILSSLSSAPKLDRFGLPVQTAENIHPLLPVKTTELVPVMNPEGDTNPTEIEDSLKDYLKVDFSSYYNAINKRNEKEYEPTIRLLHKSPPECDEYIQLSQTHDENSKQSVEIQSATFSPLAMSKRTSTTWFCHYSQQSTLLAKAKHLLSLSQSTTSLSSLNIRLIEEPQIVRYRIGEEFSWHYDEIPRQQIEQEGSGGQRIGTLLVYLNTIEDTRGGGTVFRDLVRPGRSYKNQINKMKSDKVSVKEEDRLTMRPKKGSALLFFPAKLDGTPDDRTLHKGEILREAKTTKKRDGVGDEKMIAQIWIHEREYSPKVPPGNSHDDAYELIKKKEKELGFFNDGN